MMFQNILIIGSGVIGSSVSALFALHQIKNTLWVHKTPHSQVRGHIENLLEKHLRKTSSHIHIPNVMEYIHICDFGTSKHPFDFVFEAVSEQLNLKKQIISECTKFVTESTIWASSTSSLSITDMSMTYAYPSHFIGLHFFNPVLIMELAEVIPSMVTSSDVVSIISDFAQTLGKKPIRVEDSPGFIVNRLLIPMINEAVILLETGVASAEEIDHAMRLGAHHPMGPLALADLIGNDVCLSIMETLYRVTCDSKYRPAYLLQKMVSAHKLGRKTGEGFFHYTHTRNAQNA